MLFDGKQGCGKVFYGMAFGAVRVFTVFQELSVVIIGMAVGTKIKFKRFGITSFMAFNTIDHPVTAFKRIISF